MIMTKQSLFTFKKLFMKNLLIIAIFLADTFFSFNISAQVAKGSLVSITQSEKNEIISIFKNSNPLLYRLQFEGGRMPDIVYGERKISSDEWSKIKDVGFVTGQRAIVINWLGRMMIYFNDGSIIYVSILSLTAQPKVDANEIYNILQVEGISRLMKVVGKFIGNGGTILSKYDLKDTFDQIPH